MRLHIDLCCGLGGWQTPFKQSDNWRSVGIDIRNDLNADVTADIKNLPLTPCKPDLLTMSLPCTQFSRWMLPWLDEPNPDMTLIHACLQAVNYLTPKYWVMENSRGLHQYWTPAKTHYGAFYLWGKFPPFDAPNNWNGKMQTSGMHPEERAEIPYELARNLKHAIEVWT